MRVACAQYRIEDGSPKANRARSLRAVQEAADRGADLVVLPELAVSGCDFGEGDASALAEEVPNGPTVRAWKKAGEELGIYIVGGLLERRDESLYNSAVIAGPGTFGRYRKTHLWDAEKLRYKVGEELQIFETPLGRVGLLICYDAWFPEAARTLAVRGADIICIPASAPDDWVPEAQRRGGLTMLNVHAAAHANANRLFIAAANRVGDGYTGRSCIVDVTGGVLALGGAEEELLLADIDVERARREKHLAKLSHALDDRNQAAYDVEKPDGRSPEADRH